MTNFPPSFDVAVAEEAVLTYLNAAFLALHVCFVAARGLCHACSLLWAIILATLFAMFSSMLTSTGMWEGDPMKIA